MWRCSKCETYNEGKFCVICGEAKPVDADMQNNQTNTTQQQVTVCEEAETVAVPGKRKSKGLVVLCIVLAVLLVTSLAFTAGILFSDNSDEPSATQEISKPESSETEPVEEIQELPVEEVEQQEKDVIGQNDVVPEEDGYEFYTNAEYDFYCAYPRRFGKAQGKGVNAVACYESPDGTAVLTIRAAKQPDGFVIDDALEDFDYEFDGEVTYKDNGDTWYAVSGIDGSRVHYRKFFMNGVNMYCMDFECDEQDLDTYRANIEYIEDNFKAGE